ncbi:hypothetical protein [Neorhodopirellula pilleata]|uniref:Uncharacterized protein n=1 Tax=Neorhodopirellula pilleata TaxID=2714738 RepID=A0A5C5ZPY1_9BACT|nr:hypothetical protein [Neorhodopirellula pilleata]TWT89290.1 hypothetical protein Pla100_56070 [Neorhodopirellula pilleata]
MKTPTRTAFLSIGILAGVCLLLTQTGCLGLMSNFMHAVGADQIPPECEDLKNSELAIVVMTDQSQYSDDIAARLLTRKLGGILSQEVKGLELVREDAVQQWRDTHGWDNVDYMELGKGIDAEKLLVIELTNMRLRDGATLYRGRANVRITLYDMKTEKTLFEKEIDEFTYPVNAGQYTSETTEPKFRKLYLEMLARRISRCFHAYDFADTVALDGAIASQ